MFRLGFLDVFPVHLFGEVSISYSELISFKEGRFLVDRYIFVLSFSLWLRSVPVSELHFRVLGFCDAGLIGSNRPVLKHGPRSLTYVRVCGFYSCMRNESESREILALPFFAPTTDHDL